MGSFIITVNSDTVCRVELSRHKSRQIQVSWLGGANNEVFFDVSGMDDDQHLSWSVPQLAIGDEVTIKIVADSPTDPPTSRKSAQEMDDWSRQTTPEKLAPPP